MADWTKACEVVGLLPPPVPKALSSHTSASLPPQENPRDALEQLLQSEYSHADSPVIGQSQGIPLHPPTSPVPFHPSRGYAGFWKRLVAIIHDWLLNLGVLVAFFFGVGVFMGISGTVSNHDAESWQLMGNCVGVLSWWLYFAFMESSGHQATLGKMALGIKVTDLSGRRIGFWHATGRHFAKIVSGMILLIGFLMTAFTRHKQSMHDMIAGCLVVNK
jgi:uncharacterized RDD family membrane protein YckC